MPITGDNRGSKSSSAERRGDAAKRQKLQPEELGNENDGGRSSSQRVLESPFGLMETRPETRLLGTLMEPKFNRGAMGVSLDSLVVPGIRLGLVANFMLDPQRLAEECPALLDPAARVILYHGFKQPEELKLINQAVGRMQLHNWSVQQAEVRDRWGCHHTKAFVLVYDAGIRVIVMTANLLHGDLDMKTQGIWWQDFPPKPEQGGGASVSSPFEDDLLLYLRSLEGLSKNSKDRLLEACSRHDYSRANAHLLMTIPGRHSGNKLHRFGHMQLRRLLEAEEFPEAFSAAPVVAQFSSIGAIGSKKDPQKWLRELTESFSAGRVASLLSSAGQGRPLGAASELQIVWPTGEEVRGSFEGYGAGGSIPGYREKLEAVEPLLHRWEGRAAGRERAAPHIKTYCRYSGRQLAWMAMTSSNLSKAAWGELEKNGRQLYCKSYELGVLLLPRLLEESARHGPPFWCTPEFPMPSMAVPLPPDAVLAGHQHTRPPSDAEGLQFWSSEAAGDGCAPSSTQQSTSSAPRCYLPVPYSLPPSKYRSPAEDSFWAVDKRFAKPDLLGHVYFPH